jgi:NTP pyrophosphatase (non-canonical NTP hydrolase)
MLSKGRIYIMEQNMTMNEYQALAARTINEDLFDDERCYHALHGMVGEIGELHSMYQKIFQGHKIDREHAKKELGDLLWFIAEYCTAHGWDLGEIAQMNIDKLKARYPEGFEVERSLNRVEGDV